MKLQGSFFCHFGYVVAIGVILITLTSCGKVARLMGGAADDVGQGFGRNLDEIGQAVGRSGDEAEEAVAPVLKKAVGTVDSIPAPHINSAEAPPPKVIKVVQKSDSLLDVVIDSATDQAVEVTVDCVTGLITPREAIAASQQANFVQSLCSQAVGNTEPDHANQQLDGSTRTVNAGEGYANLRSTPSTEVSTIAKIPNGTSVKLIEQTQNSSGQLWYKVEVNGQEGWIFSGLLN